MFAFARPRRTTIIIEESGEFKTPEDAEGLSKEPLEF
jgi:hypothetical protein